MIACTLCGGTAGRANPATGAHYLCEARVAHGAPTPSLGRECPDCKGRGYTARYAGVLIDPSQKAMDAAYPKCATCAGTGAVGGAP